MLRIPICFSLLLRYCIFDGIWRSALAEDCPSRHADVVHELPTGHSHLIQQRFVRSPHLVDIERQAFQPQRNATSSGIVLAAQDAGRISAKNRSTAALAVDNPHLDHETIHTSIFELSFAQLDRSLFWCVFAGMLLFTIIVDQAEAFAQRRAEHSPSNQKFLTRVNAELMMFGCVGLFLFVLGNVTDLPHDQEVILEFVDILCSMGACGLIAIAAVLYAARTRMSLKWKGLEAENLIDHPITPSGPLEVDFCQKFVGEQLSPMDYQVMATRFVMNNNLPKDFLYSAYLDETLVGNACQLMDVKFYTWLVLLVVVLGFLLVRICRQSHFPNSVYIIGFLVSNWSVFFAFCVLMWLANEAYARLILEIREDEQALQSASIKMGRRFTKRETKHLHPLSEHWSRGMKFAMQLAALLNSFLCSFYIMHLRHNLTAAGMHWLWNPLLLLPLLISLFIMLPLLISRFTAAEAYFSPDGDAMDVALSQLNQLEEDLEVIRRMWEAKGNPEFPALHDEGTDEEGLGKVLRDLGIHIAKARLHRIFKALDEDKSDTVTTEELTQRLENRLVAQSMSTTTGGFGAFTFALSKEEK